MISLSGYIHNNPCDIKEYENCIQAYPYSSLGVYLGKSRDMLNILDTDFVLSQFGSNKKASRKQYREFIQSCSDINELPKVEFTSEPCEYRSQKSLLIRNFSIDDITGYISEKMEIKEISLKVKHDRRVTESRALCVLFIRSYCDLKYKDICSAIGNITQSRASKLCSMGARALEKSDRYRQMTEEFIERYKVA